MDKLEAVIGNLKLAAQVYREVVISMVQSGVKAETCQEALNHVRDIEIKAGQVQEFAKKLAAAATKPA